MNAIGSVVCLISKTSSTVLRDAHQRPLLSSGRWSPTPRGWTQRLPNRVWGTIQMEPSLAVRVAPGSKHDVTDGIVMALRLGRGRKWCSRVSASALWAACDGLRRIHIHEQGQALRASDGLAFRILGPARCGALRP